MELKQMMEMIKEAGYKMKIVEDRKQTVMRTTRMAVTHVKEANTGLEVVTVMSPNGLIVKGLKDGETITTEYGKLENEVIKALTAKVVMEITGLN